jgi:hypothetical protein
MSKHNMPEELRKPLRAAARKEINERQARGEPIQVTIYDPRAAKRTSPATMQTQREIVRKREQEFTR